MFFCTNCGTPTGGEGKKFCTKCGAVLPEDPPADETQTALTTALPPIAREPLATVAPESFAAPPVSGPPEQPPTYVSPPGSWPSAQPAAPSYDSPAGSWPPAQAPSYDSPGPGAWPPSQPQDVPPAGPPPGPPRRPYRPRSNHTAAWIGFAAAAVLVLAGGGFAAWKFLGHHTTPHPAAAGSSNGAANQTGSGSSGSPAANSPSPLPTTPSASPTVTVPGGSFPVAATPTAAQQTGEQQVVSFLQSYFTAINNHDYGQYAPLVTSAHRPTPAEFENGFGTTTDSNATLTGLVPYGTGVAATVKFTSHQSPSSSFTGTSCTRWHITLFLQPRTSGYIIGSAPTTYRPQARAC
jgi:hypothetical protein